MCLPEHSYPCSQTFSNCHMLVQNLLPLLLEAVSALEVCSDTQDRAWC